MIEEAKCRYRFDEKGHAHFLDGRPLIGTTTAMETLAKPLTWWASGMACAEFGWVHEKSADEWERLEKARENRDLISALSGPEYLAKLDKAYRAHDTLKHSAAREGTDIHASIERYVLNCINLHAGVPQPPPETAADGPKRFFAEWACKNIKRFRWAEAHCYSEKLWVGGICDCGAILQGGMLAVLDFKRAKAVYFSHVIQLAGYCTQIKENGLFTRDGANIIAPATPEMMIVFAFGGKEVRQQGFTALYEYAFYNVIQLYKLQKDFDL